MNSPTKFSKNNFWKAQEVLFFCVSEEYEDEMSYEEFRQLLKKHRETGLLEDSNFKVDLRRNLLIDLYEDED